MRTVPGVFTTSRTLLVALTFAAALAVQPAAARPADCLVILESDRTIDGTCEFDAQPNGDFTVTSGGRSAQVMVDPGGREGRAFYYDKSPSNPQTLAIGDVHRDGACWVNRHGRVCAWTLNERPQGAAGHRTAPAVQPGGTRPEASRVVSFFSQEEGSLCIVAGPEGSSDVRVGECTSPGARFVLDAAARRLRSVQRAGQCLDGSVGGEPTLMHLRPCGPSMIEDWTYDASDRRIRGTGGCVGVVGKLDIYSKLATQTCSGSSGQRWIMNDAVGTPRPQASQQLQAATGQPRQPAFSWSPQQNGAIDRRALPAGHEANGQPLYVCAAHHNNGLHIGKIRPGFRGCNIGYGGNELEIAQYTVLTGSGRWASASAGVIPNGAVKGGAEADNRPLYVCRASFNGGVHPGKIGRNFGGCNFAYGGKERKSTAYEVLVD